MIGTSTWQTLTNNGRPEFSAHFDAQVFNQHPSNEYEKKHLTKN